MNDEEKTKRQLINELKELRKLGKIMEHSNELYYVHDTNHVLSYVSPQSLQILGYTPDEMMIQWTNLATENPINKFGVKITEKALKTGKKQKPYLLELYKKDRSTALLEIDESPMKDDLGNVVGIFGAARDITERIMAGEALKQSKEQIRILLDSTAEAIYGLDLDGKCTFVNTACIRMLGYDNESKLLGKHIHELIHYKHHDGSPYPADECKIYKAYIENRGIHNDSEVFWRADGTSFPVEYRSYPIEERGKVIGAVVTFLDITQRKQAEERLRKSEERFRALTENTTDWIWEVDQTLVYTYSSPKVKDLLGYETNEVIGKTPFDFMPEHEARRISEIAYSTMSSYVPFSSLENINIHKDGRQVILETSGIPIFDTNGNFSGYRGIDRDITDRKKTEGALKQKEKDLAIQAENLQEVNTALKVLLKKRDEDRLELEEKVLLNIKELVVPYLEKLRKSGLDERQSAYAGILKSNLDEVISSFSYRLSSTYLNLTPSEIQVANLVKQGKTNKEIAELLNVSTRTAAFHRERIRQKLGIKNKKTNLKSYLSSIN
jgi:PAS domain S-box-containing protein